METICLISCYSVFEANVIKGKLESEGIECFLTNENITNLFPVYGNMLNSGVNIIVKTKDYEIAKEIIKQEPLKKEDTIICPYCGSDKISFELGKGKIGKILAIILSLLVFVPFNNINRTNHCRECNSDFD